MTISPIDLVKKGILASARPAGGGGNITFVGSYSTGLNSPGSLTLTLPAHQADDLALITVVNDIPGAAITETAAGGYTTEMDKDYTDGRSRRIAIFSKILTSGSETDPVVDWAGTGEACAAVHIFRGVNTTTPLDTTITEDDSANVYNMTAPNITTVTNNAALVLVHYVTHSDVSAFNGPAGYTDGEEQLGSFRNMGVAYLLDAGAAGAKVPGDWNNTGSGLTSESTVHTIALRPA